MNPNADVNKTIEMVKTARTNPDEALTKAFTQSGSAISGITAYSLEAPAKQIYPVHTPLRNMIPRVGGGAGIQANWRAVVGINSAHISPGVGEGNRGGVISTATADYIAIFRALGLDDNVTFEADMAAEGMDDLKNLSVTGLLRSLMIAEENVILGGNGTRLLGTTPTPTATQSTGGTLADASYQLICVALTLDGWNAVAGMNNGTTGESLNPATAKVPGAISRTNADGSVDTYGGGSAAKSAAAAATVSSGSNTASITAHVAAVPGAVAYAWFFGTSGSEKLNQVTTINSVKITAVSDSGAQNASALSGDNSKNALIFDGLLAQCFVSGSGAYLKTLATGTDGVGTYLASNGQGGVTQIDDAFAAFWNSYRLSPGYIVVNAQELKNITGIVIKNGGAPLIRLNAMANASNTIVAGTRVGTVLNTITGEEVTLLLHANCPPGTILFWSKDLPYKLPGVTNTTQMKLRREYYQIEWPLKSRKWEYGIYMDGVLQHYFPPSMGVINNIANGIG